MGSVEDQTLLTALLVPKINHFTLRAWATAAQTANPSLAHVKKHFSNFVVFASGC